MKNLYLYSLYERLWHWLQALLIGLLLITGIKIRFPEFLEIVSFKTAIQMHKFFAAFFLLNAFLSLFYHLTNGRLSQFIPSIEEYGAGIILQLKYYISGIFTGKLHPFEKSREKKLNPLQKIVYFSLLNLLLPLQSITGTFLFLYKQFPQLENSWGIYINYFHLTIFHAFLAWLFISFFVVHLYLITTGVTILSNLKAMFTGWEYHPDNLKREGKNEN